MLIKICKLKANNSLIICLLFANYLKANYLLISKANNYHNAIQQWIAYLDSAMLQKEAV